MPTMETALLSAGRAIAQRAVGVWLAGKTAREERNADLKELIKGSFRDQVARRRFEHQVQGIAMAVEDRLRVLVEQEFRGLDEPARAAVLLEVVAAVQRADLSDEALMADDADPVKVAERVMSALPAPRLGEAEDRLYEVLLAESVECVVRMIRHLPQFAPRAAAETLGRLSGLADQVERLLERVPVRTLDAPEGAQDDAAFEHRYLTHVSQVLDEVELFGVRLENYRPTTSLSVAYISLSASTTASRRPRELDRLPPASLTEPDRPSAGAMRVEAALGRSVRTLVRGEAGSGKSTLLRWLAVTAARGRFSGDLADWDGSVPFVIKLRSHGGGRFPEPERFLHDVAGAVAGSMPRGWVERVLACGRGLLLVDGVDELVAGHRTAVRQWLSRLLAAYPSMRVVVTSRPAAADARWLVNEGFETALLEPMTPGDLRELVRQWHEAMRGCPSLPCTADELESYERALLARMESNPHLRLLAATPLLAAMLCALNLDQRRQLPRNRMGLYEAVLSMLLERRDVERGIQAEITLEPEQKVWILRELAWRLVSMGRSEMSKQTAMKRIEDKLAAMTRMPYSAEQVMEHLLTRSGVLREPVPGRIDFVHKTVQEYLAAGQLVEDEDVEVAVERAHLDQWREVVIMVAGHATGRLRRELLRGLLDRADQKGRHARRIKLLIASCLETIQEMPVELRDRLEACLAEVIPPRNEAETQLLAAVGWEVLRRLPDDLSGLPLRQASLTVRTAWLVNGPEAMAKLSHYSSDRRQRVLDEVVEGWNYFDAEGYAREVLAGMPPEQDITVRDLRLLRGLRQLPRLKGLSVVAEEPITDLGFVAGLPELRSLVVYDTRADESHVGSGTRPPLPLDPLGELQLLETLVLDDVHHSGDLSFLDGLPRLTHLALPLPRHPGPDLRPLTRRRSLHVLELMGSGQGLDPGLFTDMNRLSSLRLKDFGELIGGITALAAACPSLWRLHIGAMDLPDLDQLHRLPLHGFGLFDNPNLRNLTFLNGLTSLQRLWLRRLPISDLTPIARLRELTLLNLNGCTEIEDLSPAGQLPQLKHLDLIGAREDLDLAPLANCRNLVITVTRGQQVRNEHLLHPTTKIERI
ncbi:NACHT domain-containing protein [Thermoactinospora rubra]|uniref:NACHT N-terminal Helical domain 1-containing protein n=1 Tax=Thermoactinospora rubra TaxID=1088767 RepID=UPI000A11DDCE|nr:NACHT domain-containing protein [Thermoactinospora rubra]